MDASTLTQVAEQGDPGIVLDWVLALDDDGRAEAARWWTPTLWHAADGRLDTPRDVVRTVELALAAALVPEPERAVRVSRWDQRWQGLAIERNADTVRRVVEQRGSQWALAYAHALAALPLGAGVMQQAQSITAVALPILTRSGSEVPGGPVAVGWCSLVMRDAVTRAHVGGHGQQADHRYDELARHVVPAFRAASGWPHMFYAALDTERAFDLWRTTEVTTPRLSEAVATLLADGDLDRTSLVERALLALARDEPPSHQAVYGEVLRGCGVDADDARAHADVIVNLAATAPSQVLGLLLHPVLALGPDAGAYLDVGLVVAARKEKTHRRTLLADVASRPLTAATEEILEVLATDPDRQISTKASTVLARLRTAAGRPGPPPAATAGTTSPPPTAVEWDVPERELPREPLPELPVDPATYAALLSRVTPLPWQVWGALVVDLTRRRAAVDLAALEAHLDSAARALPLEAHVALAHLRGVAPRGGSGWRLYDGFLREAAADLGSSLPLLSTPSWMDGFIAPADLERRLAASDEVGPFDLVLALLRLDLTVPESVDRWRVPGPRVVIDGAVHDAHEVVRAWAAAGGVPVRTIHLHDGKVRVAAVEPPLPRALRDHSGVAQLLGPIVVTVGERRYGDTCPVRNVRDLPLFLTLAPDQTEAAAAVLASPDDRAWLQGRLLDVLASAVFASGRAAGPAVHLTLALAHDTADPEGRDAVVRALRNLAATRAIDRAELAAHVGVVLDSGWLSVARAVKAWEEARAYGLARWLWPSALVALRHGLSRARRPAALADLVRVLTPVVGAARAHGEVDVVPVALREVASSRARSVLAEEARQYVAAAETAADTTGWHVDSGEGRAVRPGHRRGDP